MDGREAARTSLDRIRIVLVEPKEPGNIGAVARAMKNMGLSRLYLVAPPDFRSGDARKMAHGSGDVLYGATVFETLEDALAGTALVVGTTPLFNTAEDGIAFFFTSVPYNFYGIFALLSTFNDARLRLTREMGWRSSSWRISGENWAILRMRCRI